ncbi:pilus assembly protein TadG-related protein [Streptomyces syringium]|uniref:pilus assembly protein TadG-related protein n=1 Tax=Streptomyces syringium TaxID=76729 RepID=UPI0033B5C0B6
MRRAPSARQTADAGQAFPLYITAVAGLLFLALAFFTVGRAGAAKNGAQTAADAAALAAAQSYRDQLGTSFLHALRTDAAWQGIVFDGQLTVAVDVCGAALRYAKSNGASVRGCAPAYTPPSFTVAVESLKGVGKSVIPGTEGKKATATATALVTPLCAPDASPPKQAPKPSPSKGKGDEGDRDEGGGSKGKGGKDDEGKGGEKPPERPAVLFLDCDGKHVTIDPGHPDRLPDTAELFAVHLAD